MLEIFHIHGSVARLINRGLSCVFSRSFLTQDISSEPIVGKYGVYWQMVLFSLNTLLEILISPASWPGDLAMSMTWFPERNFWYAVVYGCDPSTEVEISGRLRYSGDAICHPLLIPGIFAELERKRQIKMVKQGSLKLVETVATLHEAHHMPSDADHSPGPDLTANKEVDPWLDIFHKKNGLLNWKDQLNKMVTHAEELNITNFSHDINQSSDINEFRKLMRDTGDRIKERLQDIIREYDERIRDCERNLEGMSLANQMVR
ncbi:hypothetical protein CCHR01_09385 [Colletotrichum chrysophilum]|uniref:Uncharacterized protein n=1 Tax=Colletotrichum chrysophilum TaxID=1836956 RepID=A0AAD9EGT9_9PEZI|nr:hypothetical protein CCHR01_09385 [Colletotrichum chrysophilum]